MSDVPILIPKEGRELAAARVQRFVLDAYPGKPLEVIVRKRKRERSDPQNRTLFGVMYPVIMDFCGLSGEEEKQELHATFCGDYWGWTEYSIRGHRKRKPKRTTTTNEEGRRDVISTLDFMAFCAFIQRTMAPLGCFVPDPDPEWFSKEAA